MSKEKIYVPPIKIQGIKTKIVPLIKANVILNSETVWIEPFMGSGVVGFNVAPRQGVFADINPHLIAFYNQIKSRQITSGIVRSFLEEEGRLLAEKDGEHYYAVRERFNKEHSPLDFLFLNRACFNGMIRFNKDYGFNVPYGHKPLRFAKAYVTKIVNQVKYVEECLKDSDWTFLCQSFETTLSALPPNAFIYCDPPYIGRHIDYYDSWDISLEKALCRSLEKTDSYYMLSTWDHNIYRYNECIETVWGKCHKLTQEHFYHVGAKEENRNRIVEALLTNYRTNGKQNLLSRAQREPAMLF